MVHSGLDSRRFLVLPEVNHFFLRKFSRNIPGTHCLKNSNFIAAYLCLRYHLTPLWIFGKFLGVCFITA